MHKHTVNQDETGIYALHRDGIICLCPKLMFPQIVTQQPSPLRQPEHVTQLHRLPCTTACPFAQVKETEKIKEGTVAIEGTAAVYTISCEGMTREIELDEVKHYVAPEAKSPLSIAAK